MVWLGGLIVRLVPVALAAAGGRPVALGLTDGTAGVPLALGLCAVALGLAWPTLRLVENPVRFTGRSGDGRTGPWRSASGCRRGRRCWR